jgi:hypothetical protein
MALRLKSNPAPRRGALYVSNPRKRKPVRRKNRAVKKLRVVRKRRNGTKKGQVRKTARRAYSKRKNVAKKRRTSVAKKRRNVSKKRRVVRKRRNVAKKRVVRKNRRNPVRKRRNVAKKRRVVRKRKNVMRKRKNVMRKRRNGTRKGMVRKTARRAYSKRKNRRNPVRKTRIIRKNPMTLSFLKPVEKLVSKIPLIGKKVAPYTQPAIIAMAGGAGVVGGMNYVGKLPVVGQYAKYPFGHAFGYTVMGLSLAVLSAVLPVKNATKKALALSFAGAGGALNMAQLMMCGFDLQQCALQNQQMLGVSSLSEDAVAGFGDGMYYEIEPLSGIAVDMAGIDYETAQYGDASACPSDLSAMEGQMAMHGRDAYLHHFGAIPHKMAGQKQYHSSMAGTHGHRWGWLIKSLGYQRFAQLAQLPPQQRKKLIRKLKASAIQASQATFDQELTGAYQGISYSGLAMDMSGLAIDNMAGIAITGAGI